MSKVILITGASSGIGKAIGDFLTINGFKVYGTSRDSSSYLNSKFELLDLDVKNLESIISCVEKIIKIEGKIDVLINNAGITKDNLLMRMQESDFDVVIDVNLKSVFNMTKAVQRTMLKQRYGSIINMSSVVGVKGNAGQTNYAASKAGIIGFSKSVALELGSRNIRCNVVAPGFIETEMTAKLDENVVNEWRKGIPLKRGGTPLDIANTCVWLASDLSSYVTGQVINVDGGMLT